MAKGVLKLQKSVNAVVTYHDPCYLGLRSESYKPYDGVKESRPVAFSRTGEMGVYDAPRKLLAAIPGVKLFEMDRIKGYAWCCGGGAGVQQAYPELTEFSSNECMREAKATKAKLTGEHSRPSHINSCKYYVPSGRRRSVLLDGV